MASYSPLCQEIINLSAPCSTPRVPKGAAKKYTGALRVTVLSWSLFNRAWSFQIAHTLLLTSLWFLGNVPALLIVCCLTALYSSWHFLSVTEGRRSEACDFADLMSLDVGCYSIEWFVLVRVFSVHDSHVPFAMLFPKRSLFHRRVRLQSSHLPGCGGVISLGNAR